MIVDRGYSIDKKKIKKKFPEIEGFFLKFWIKLFTSHLSNLLEENAIQIKFVIFKIESNECFCNITRNERGYWHCLNSRILISEELHFNGVLKWKIISGLYHLAT
jgi:uncharacterized UPF0160 family protein